MHEAFPTYTTRAPLTVLKGSQLHQPLPSLHRHAAAVDVFHMSGEALHVHKRQRCASAAEAVAKGSEATMSRGAAGGAAGECDEEPRRITQALGGEHEYNMRELFDLWGLPADFRSLDLTPNPSTLHSRNPLILT
jgi:hypothetical protein